MLKMREQIYIIYIFHLRFVYNPSKNAGSSVYFGILQWNLAHFNVIDPVFNTRHYNYFFSILDVEPWSWEEYLCVVDQSYFSSIKMEQATYFLTSFNHTETISLRRREGTWSKPTTRGLLHLMEMSGEGQQGKVINT